MLHLALLWALLGAQPLDAPRPPLAWLAGQYDTLSSGPSGCTLSIGSDSAYTRRCGDAEPYEGAVDRFGNVLALELSPHDEEAMTRRLREYDEKAQEHARAAWQFYQQHFEEHGFYPLVAPLRPPDLGPAGILTAPVLLDQHLYLVDLFDRERFCASLLAGQPPRTTDPQHPTYRSRMALGEPGGLDPDSFCSTDWRLDFEQHPQDGSAPGKGGDAPSEPQQEHIQ